MLRGTRSTWVLNVAERTITVGDRSVRLRRSELNIVKYLTDHAGRPVAASELLSRALFGCGDGSAARHQIFEIRRKLRTIGAEHLMLTEWGVGYRMTTAPVTGDGPKEAETDPPQLIANGSGVA